jgi:S-adenosylmethionine-dependent methyltransferase
MVAAHVVVSAVNRALQLAEVVLKSVSRNLATDVFVTSVVHVLMLLEVFPNWPVGLGRVRVEDRIRKIDVLAKHACQRRAGHVSDHLRTDLARPLLDQRDNRCLFGEVLVPVVRTAITGRSGTSLAVLVLWQTAYKRFVCHDDARELDDAAKRRVTFVQANGENADEALGGQRFSGVLCHGVLGYLESPEPVVKQLCRCAAAGGIVSIMTGNAHATAVQPALQRRWDDALAAFDQRTGIGVLGVRGRADTVEEVSELIKGYGVEPERWYGVWLFVDWLEFSGAELDPSDMTQVAATAAVELEASRRDPYRQLSRVFHLIGRKAQS